ncbi:hypothetical protein DSO57_1018095 [Entomophthora muscae]|uniref:Uncharacterized protein n=1 Tax=Entomophthora muscae TaxID=34485 RepID=A0ACC2TRI1_9FUNG|nr:hypothetical protein DSO57_1018095 [Entomophthora muscae]
MPRNYYFLVGIIYFCTNTIILFASIYESTPQYNRAYLLPPGSAPVTLVKPPCTLDLEFFHPHHLDLPPGHSRVAILSTIKEIPIPPPLPNVPPAQDFSKLGFYWGWPIRSCPIQEVAPLATAVNYIVRMTPIVYRAFQAWPASPVGVQPDSGMGRDSYDYGHWIGGGADQQDMGSPTLSGRLLEALGSCVLNMASLPRL